MLQLLYLLVSSIDLVFLCVCVCARVCVCACGVCVPSRGGHGNMSFACLVMWLVAAPLSQVMWWRTGRVRDPCVVLAI